MIDELRAFGVPLTYAVLPFETKTAAVAARLAELGEEVLCHLPMEAQHGENPGPGALTEAMNQEEIRDATRRALEAVPGAIGVNNHMGSALSEDPEAMAAMLGVVRKRGLFFLDSRTSAASVAYGLAREAGVPAAERKVFLDGDRNAERDSSRVRPSDRAGEPRSAGDRDRASLPRDVGGAARGAAASGEVGLSLRQSERRARRSGGRERVGAMIGASRVLSPTARRLLPPR